MVRGGAMGSMSRGCPTLASGFLNRRTTWVSVAYGAVIDACLSR